jgi:glutamate:GABA antiporter
MDEETYTGGAPGLRRALGTFDLVLLNVAAIVGLRWLSTAAQLGPSSLTLWVVGCLLFFVPSGLAVQELSSRIPHEGGFHLWTKAAFGELHGFLAGWAYWLSNLVFFPSLLLFATVVAIQLGGPETRKLAESPWYNGIAGLAVLWGVTYMNILGLRRAKWLQNAAGIATFAATAQIVFAGFLAWWHYGSATPLTAASLVPNLSSPYVFNTFAILILAYTGFELAPLLGDEIRDTERSVRRAVYISGALITIIYVAGTAALLMALPVAQINVISGVPEAMNAIGARSGLPFFGLIAVVLITITSLGGLSGWVAGTARLPFVIGLSHYLPEQLGAIHPRYRSPHVALLVQAGAVSLAMLAAISGSTIHEAFLLLIDMTVALNCAVWVYIFASLLVLRRRAAGRNEGIALVPGGLLGCTLVAVVGALAAACATVVSMIPPSGSDHPALFLVKGIGGCALILAAGIVVFRSASKRGAR